MDPYNQYINTYKQHNIVEDKTVSIGRKVAQDGSSNWASTKYQSDLHYWPCTIQLSSKQKVV